MSMMNLIFMQLAMITIMMVTNMKEASSNRITHFLVQFYVSMMVQKMIAKRVLIGNFTPKEDNLLEPANLIRACDPNLARCLSDIITKMSPQ